MKKILFLFCVATAFVFEKTAIAQATEIKIGSVTKSIVRETNNDMLLVYTEVSPTESYFVYYHEGDIYASAFRLPSFPSFLKVYDVRIWGECAYFCGSVDLPGGSPDGLIGRFNIQDVFSGTGSVDYISVGAFPASVVDIDSLYRLEMYSASGYDCMAMVGVAQYAGMTIYPVVSAYYNGTNWQFHTASQKDYPRFTDIACLDNMIVAAGTFYHDSLCFVKTYYKVRDFPLFEFDTNNIYYFTYGTVRGKPLIAQYKNNIAVLAYFDLTSGVRTVLHYQPFNATTGKPVSPGSAKVTTPPSTLQYSNEWSMKELTSVNDSVFLLQRAAYPMSPDPTNLHDWRLKAPSASLMIDAWNPMYEKQFSMDVSHARITSSTSLSNFLLLHGSVWPSFSNSCQTYFSINATDVSVFNKRTAFEVEPHSMNNGSLSLSPVIIEIDAYSLCEF